MFLELIDKYKYTHMPYIFYKDMQPKMLFTVMQNFWWKLYFCDGKECYKIKTPLDNILGTTNYHMCQPTCYYKDNIYHVSFCIQINGKIRLYYVQTENITNLQDLILVKDNCYGGCVNQKFIFINYLNTLNIYDRNKYSVEYMSKNENVFSTKQLIFNIHNISRTSYIYNHLDELIISYVYPNNTSICGSFIIDLNNLQIQKRILTKDNKPMYKATIDPLTNTIYYGQKTGLNLQQRKIRKTNFKECNIQQFKIINE